MNISMRHLTAKKYCSNFRLSIHIYVMYVPFILYITSRIYNNVIILLMTFTHAHMFVHIYVCMYVCMYVCTYVRTYVCMCVCMYVHMYVRTYVCVYVCMYVCMYVCIYYPI